MTSQSQREQRRERRSARRIAEERAARRKRQVTIIGGTAAVALIAVLALILVPLLNNNGASAAIQIAQPPAAEIPTDGRTMGDPNAPVKLVEFGDYQCPACKFFNDQYKQQLINDYVKTGKVQLEFRDFSFIGKESFQAAEAALCADDQGKFWQYHDSVYLNQGGENSGALSDSRLKSIAKEVGLDSDKFNSCLSSNTHQNDVQKSSDDARAQGVQSTPSFMVNGQLIQYTGYPSLQTAIDAQLKK